MDDSMRVSSADLSAVVVGAGSQGRVHALGYLATPGWR